MFLNNEFHIESATLAVVTTFVVVVEAGRRGMRSGAEDDK